MTSIFGSFCDFSIATTVCGKRVVEGADPYKCIYQTVNFFEVLMNDQHYPVPEGQERSSYSTGATQPGKSHRGAWAVLLVSVILACGLVTAMGLMNIRLFRDGNGGKSQEISFRFDGETVPALGGETDPTQAVEETRPVRMELQASPQAAPNVPQAGGLSLQEIYAHTAPCVVSVICNLDNGTATGCGVVLSEKGYIVTSAYLLQGVQGLSLVLPDGRQVTARIVGTDSASDLAVLYTEAEGLQAASFGDDSSLLVGDAVAAIGDPLGPQLRGTMREGIVSAIHRDVRVGSRLLSLIQTDAAPEGYAGGPLINCYGQVVGIHTVKFGDSLGLAQVEELSLAVPSTTVKGIVDQLLSRGTVGGNPRLGVTVEQVSAFSQIYHRYPAGLYITHVESGTDAAAKGLLPGDILLSMDGVRIARIETLQKLLQDYAVGDRVELVIYRKGQQYQLELTLSAAVDS